VILTPTLRNILNASVLTPILALGSFVFVVIIVLCVYLKEHFKVNFSDTIFNKEGEGMEMDN